MTAAPTEPLELADVRRAAGPAAAAGDAELVAAAAGDRAGFAAIYDRYADRLYDFCVGMLRDRDAAADCVQEVFCTAATRLAQLREPDKLRPWLYAIARREALAVLRERRREEPAAELPDDTDGQPDLAVLAARSELTELVRHAAGGLSERDQTVLELHYHHGLDGPELATALGVTPTNANTLVGRLRATVDRSLGAYLLARRAHQGHGDCADLANVLSDWDGHFTVLCRKRVARHVDSCVSCQDQRARMVDPRTLLATAPAALPVPTWLRDHVLTRVPVPPVAAAGAGLPPAPPGNRRAARHRSPRRPRVPQSAKLAASAVSGAAAVAAIMSISAPRPTAAPVPIAAPVAEHTRTVAVAGPSSVTTRTGEGSTVTVAAPPPEARTETVRPTTPRASTVTVTASPVTVTAPPETTTETVTRTVKVPDREGISSPMPELDRKGR